MSDNSPQFEAMSPLPDESVFREALGHFCSGLTVIAAHHESGPVGFTCQSFFSVSLVPPLVAFSVAKTSTSYPLIRSVGTITINVLAHDQHEISNSLARSGADKWSGIKWTKGNIYPNPVITGALAVLECDIDREFDAGDHVLTLARVQGLLVNSHREPLLYYRGNYGLLDKVDML